MPLENKRAEVVVLL